MTPLPPDMSHQPSSAFYDAVESASSKLLAVQKAIGQIIFGQEDVVSNSLATLLAGGHILLIGLPGLAKTRLVKVLSKALGLDMKRIQCTPDLMPSDVIGAEVLEEVDYGRRNFRFVQGPVFCQFLMVDEINRASPRTQSALLQAMQEGQVTMAGREHTLPTPFHVLATQNPIEQEGVFPLPEAQLDRFMVQINIGYPDLASERRILADAVVESPPIKNIMYATDLRETQELVRQIPVSTRLAESILSLVRNGRPETSNIDLVKKYVSWGPGPRASHALSLIIRARALLDGRTEPTYEDLLSLVKPVLRHRMALNFSARADGVSLEHVIAALTQSIRAS